MAAVKELIVFFEGTANTLRPPTTQIANFAAACIARDVTQAYTDAAKTDNRLKMMFDGCGVTNGIGGVLFAKGLDEQCARVATRVEEILSEDPAGNARVRCIVLGLSRGGIACGKLALALSATEKFRKRVDMSTLMYDPVPGNLVWTKLPFTGWFSQDLTSCTNLRDVLAIYPHEPLPALAMHAPLLFKYPESCRVEEDVTLGCHQGALLGTANTTRQLRAMVDDRGNYGTVTIASNLSFRRISDWFATKNVRFDFKGMYEPSHDECLAICKAALTSNWLTNRSLHDATGKKRVILRRGVDARPQYLNRYHEQAERGQAARDSGGRPIYMLDIIQSNPCCH